VLEARRAIARGEVVAILADRTPPAERSRASRVAFLGAPAPIPQGSVRLAAALGVPVLFMVALRTAMRATRSTSSMLATASSCRARAARPRSTRFCQSYADRLAAHCRRAPYQWFNFFDFLVRRSGAADVRAD
jgi:predicted LPLAT superfamily acyltransferase